MSSSEAEADAEVQAADEEEMLALNPPAAARGKGKGKVAPFTAEQRDIAIDFLKERPYIYDKAHPDYKDYPRRKREWTHLAEMLEVTPDALAKWYKSVRVMLARAKRLKGKSGSGSSLSAGLQSVEEQFGFITPFIHEMTSTVVGGKRKRNSGSSAPSFDPEEPGPSRLVPRMAGAGESPRVSTASSLGSLAVGGHVGPSVQRSPALALPEYSAYLKEAVDTLVTGLQAPKVAPFWLAVAERGAAITDTDSQLAMQDEVWGVVNHHLRTFLARRPPHPPLPPQQATYTGPAASSSTLFHLPSTPTTTLHPLHTPTTTSFEDLLLQSPVARRSPRKSTPRKRTSTATISSPDLSTISLQELDYHQQ
jgi:hypothetical protein